MPLIHCSDPGIRALKGLHLYHSGVSNHSMRVRMVLAEKRLPWTGRQVDLRAAEHLSDWYLKVNPRALVPTLVDDGVVVIDSRDILCYLDERYPDPKLIPEEPLNRQRVEQWLELASTTHVRTTKTFMRAARNDRAAAAISSRYRAVQTDPELLRFHEMAQRGIELEEKERAADEIRAIFRRIGDELGRNPWLAGDMFSLADITWVSNRALLSTASFPFDDDPRVTEWSDRIAARPSYQSAIAAWLPGGRN